MFTTIRKRWNFSISTTPKNASTLEHGDCPDLPGTATSSNDYNDDDIVQIALVQKLQKKLITNGATKVIDQENQCRDDGEQSHSEAKLDLKRNIAMVTEEEEEKENSSRDYISSNSEQNSSMNKFSTFIESRKSLDKASLISTDPASTPTSSLTENREEKSTTAGLVKEREAPLVLSAVGGAVNVVASEFARFFHSTLSRESSEDDDSKVEPLFNRKMEEPKEQHITVAPSNPWDRQSTHHKVDCHREFSECTLTDRLGEEALIAQSNDSSDESCFGKTASMDSSEHNISRNKYRMNQDDFIFARTPSTHSLDSESNGNCINNSLAITASQSLPSTCQEMIDPTINLSYRMREIPLIQHEQNGLTENVDRTSFSDSQRFSNQEDNLKGKNDSPGYDDNEQLVEYKCTPSDQKWFSPRKKWSESQQNDVPSSPPSIERCPSLPDSYRGEALNPIKACSYRARIVRRSCGGTPLSLGSFKKSRRRAIQIKYCRKTLKPDESVRDPIELNVAENEAINCHAEQQSPGHNNASSNASPRGKQLQYPEQITDFDCNFRHTLSNNTTASDFPPTNNFINLGLDLPVSQGNDSCVSSEWDQHTTGPCTLKSARPGKQRLAAMKNSRLVASRTISLSPKSANFIGGEATIESLDAPIAAIATNTDLDPETQKENIIKGTDTRKCTEEHKVAEVKQEEDYSWAYAVWRRKGLLLDPDADSSINKLSVATDQQTMTFDVSSKHIGEIKSKSEALKIASRGIGDNLKKSNVLKGRKSLPVSMEARNKEMTASSNKSFANILQQWRSVSDDKPCTHFLSPESQLSCRVADERVNSSISTKSGHGTMSFFGPAEQLSNKTLTVELREPCPDSNFSSIEKSTRSPDDPRSPTRHHCFDAELQKNETKIAADARRLVKDLFSGNNNDRATKNVGDQNAFTVDTNKIPSTTSFYNKAQLQRFKSPSKSRGDYKTVCREFLRETDMQNRSKSAPRSAQKIELPGAIPVEQRFADKVADSFGEKLNDQFQVSGNGGRITCIDDDDISNSTYNRNRAKSVPRLRQNSQMAMSLSTLRAKLTKEYSDGQGDERSLNEPQARRSSRRVLDLLEEKKKSLDSVQQIREKCSVPETVDISRYHRRSTFSDKRINVELSIDVPEVNLSNQDNSDELDDGALSTRRLVESFRKSFEFCRCSSSLFSGNDDMIDFFLPLTGTACVCGRRPPGLQKPDEPTSLVNILRPWQVDFLASYGIHRGDQLVKAHHRSAQELAKALRRYRKKNNMKLFATKNCASALKIWSKTSKAFVRSIRAQIAAGMTASDFQIPNPVPLISSFLDLGTPTEASHALSTSPLATSKSAASRQSSEGFNRPLRAV